MTFSDFLQSGIAGYYARQHLAGNAYAIVTGIAIVFCMLTYLLGSINFSIVISKRLHGDDIRTHGSGNAGTTNMLRTYGRRAAILTLGGDALKAIVSCLYGYTLMGFTGAYMAGFFCILGHCFPIYYRFRGGKGIVTAAFMILMLDPLIFAILFVVFVLLILGTRMVSFGSIITAMLFPILLDRLRGPGIPVIFAILIMMLLVFMHRENIIRIYRGKESKIDLGKLFGKKKKDREDNNEIDTKDSDK